MKRPLRRPAAAPSAGETRAAVRDQLLQQRAAATATHAAMTAQYEQAMHDSALALEALDLADRIEAASQ